MTSSASWKLGTPQPSGESPLLDQIISAGLSGLGGVSISYCPPIPMPTATAIFEMVVQATSLAARNKTHSKNI